jgi:hypothetical protein
MVELQEQSGGRILVVRLAGKLSKEDYEKFIPVVDRLIQQHGKIRVLVEMHDFHGWTAGALWEDIKFDLKHFGDIEKLAMIGESRWQKGMSVFCKPFTSATIRYFPHDQATDAMDWLLEEIIAPAH